MTALEGIAPVAPARRLPLLDALRGLALFGIIQINLPAFLVGPDPIYALLGDNGSRSDWIAFVLDVLLIEAKFYPLFAFLFGYGFALQWQGMRRRGQAPQPLLIRRYGALVALGVVHGSLLFFGDILTMYGLCGLLLIGTAPRGARMERRRVLIWLLFSLLLLAVQLFGPDAPAAVAATDRDALDQALAQALAQLAHGPFIAAAVDRARLYAVNQSYQLAAFLPQLLFFMSLGACAARLRLFARPARHRRIWRTCLVVGLGIGLPVNILLAACEARLAQPGGAPALVVVATEGLYPFACLLTPAYVAAVVYASLAAARQPWLGVCIALLSRLGRLALTNYLVQSLGMLLLFSSIGLGLADRLSLVELVAIGFCACLVQTLAAALYLRFARTGPAEWLWRRFVYG